MNQTNLTMAGAKEQAVAQLIRELASVILGVPFTPLSPFRGPNSRSQTGVSIVPLVTGEGDGNAYVNPTTNRNEGESAVPKSAQQPKFVEVSNIPDNQMENGEVAMKKKHQWAEGSNEYTRIQLVAVHAFPISFGVDKHKSTKLYVGPILLQEMRRLLCKYKSKFQA